MITNVNVMMMGRRRGLVRPVTMGVVDDGQMKNTSVGRLFRSLLEFAANNLVMLLIKDRQRVVTADGPCLVAWFCGWAVGVW